MRIVVATAILVLAPRAALACPACALAGVDTNSTAYVSMSLVLMALPLGMILGIATWLYRSVRRAEVESWAGKPSSAPFVGHDRALTPHEPVAQ